MNGAASEMRIPENVSVNLLREVYKPHLQFTIAKYVASHN